MLAPWQESYDKPRQCIKKQRNHFANKGLSNQSYVFTSVMYGCESWTIKKAEYQRTDAFKLWCWRRFLTVPWTERRPINSKGDMSWVFFGRNDAKAETPVLWPPHGKELTQWKRL